MMRPIFEALVHLSALVKTAFNRKISLRGAGFAVAAFYLCFHALNGDRGLYALLRESQELEEASAELDAVTAERTALEHHVRLLSDASLDLDLLDERARLMTGVAASDEAVYLAK